MRKRTLGDAILSLFLVLSLIGGSTLALDAEDAGQDPITDVPAESAPAVDGETTSDEIAAEVQAPIVAEPADLQHLWSLFLGDLQINMVLRQKGSDLYGAAKYEGAQPWNGLVIGSVSGDQVWLVMTALKGKDLLATRMTGTYDDPQITGTYQQYDAYGEAASGSFSAIWLDGDVSSFTPAVIQEVATTASSAAPAADIQDTGSEAESRFTDVRKYADMVGPAGLIPPGMG
ncbi:MAG: hypothetical protein JW986_10000 [Methanotrichaceae archaeon]|nr:hypothetical protein [Methanotrichaceae archaeon]